MIRPGIRRLFRLPLRGRKIRERELDEEIDLHLELRAEQLTRQGLSPEEARAEARRRFGSPEEARTALRQAARRREDRIRVRSWLVDLRQDLLQGTRVLRRNPAFSIAAILTIALGIGATTTVFSLVNGVILRPLEYRDSDRLVALFTAEVRGLEARNPTSPANFHDWKEQSRTLESMTAAHPWAPTLTGGEVPVKLQGLKATPALFELLGARPLLGRVFRDGGQDPGRVVVVGYDLWRRVLGGDPDVVGRSLMLEGEPHTVLGVMPPGFEFPPFWATGAELWVPLAFSPEEASRRNASFLRVFARLAPGATLGQAREEMRAIAERLAAAHPAANRDVGVNVEPLQEPVVSGARPALLILLGAAAFLLLIACANVANLLLGRVAARGREHAIRAALGAGRGRLARQWLAESLLLTLLGGAAGLLLAVWGVRGLAGLAPGQIPRLSEVRPDTTMLGFALLVSLLTAAAAGAGPALRASRLGVGDPLRGRSGESRGRSRARRLLAGVQVAIALVLLTGAGLLIRSFVQVARVEPGFRASGLYTVQLSLGASAHAAPDRQPVFYRALTDRIEGLPGVQSAGVVNHLPIAGDLWRGEFAPEGVPIDPTSLPKTSMRVVGEGYFSAMGIPILSGREFADEDREGGVPVVIVNQELARRYWPGENPVGRRLREGGADSDEAWLTVVGVAGDVRQAGLTEPVIPEVYFPYGQNPFPWYTDATLVVRHSPAWAGARALQEQVWALDRGVPAHGAAPMEQILSRHLQRQRFHTILLGTIAAVALTLASTGLYGVIGYLVAQRTREIGVRMALGATPRGVLLLVLSEGLLVAGAGAVAGLVVAGSLSRLLGALLFGISPTDPVTFGGVLVLVVVVALVASYLPARRAMRVDPIEVLQAE